VDMRLPNMLYGALAQSPTLGGKAKSFDAARARQMPGVRDVVSTSRGIVVLADSWWQARQARDTLTIEWDAGPNASLDNAAIMRGLEQALATRANEAQVARNDDNADAALASAGRQIEAIYELPSLAHETQHPQHCTDISLR